MTSSIVMHLIARHDQAAAGWVRSFADLQFHGQQIVDPSEDVGEQAMRVELHLIVEAG